VTVASMLGEFMQDLQKTAEKKDIGSGEWVAVLPDHSMLQKVAAEAGMGEADMSLLHQQLEVQRGELNLADFLNILGQHFQTITDAPAITVPETELPFLETLLAKMGLSLEDINALSNKAVKNEGILDLSIFLEGLQHVTDGDNSQNTRFHGIQLSDWESEQLQNLLAQAGARQGKLTELFPERYFEKISGGQQKEFTLSFEKLQDMLSKAIEDINQNRPQPNLPGFLKELDHVLSYTQFTDESVGWTPVIQQSLTAVFREMQDAIDLARKRFTEEMFLENKGIEEELQTLQQSILEGKTGTMAEHFSKRPSDANLNLNEFAQAPSLHETVINFSPFQVATDSSQEAQLINSTQNSHVVTRSPQQLQLQVFQQISAAVMHGIRNDEHHLVLRLYPQELGEVKVDLLVRDGQVSVTFNMENSRVKEMLESNMEQFRENMEQRGFALGECTVSVGQQDDFDNDWRRFMMSGNEGAHKKETLEDIPDDVLYLRENILQQEGREGALNLFV
ncbi:MAG: flagellar hook-length control protein FliK, partial [Desulfobulbaceae bacterium]|nr:flagellar hook-length control protein FliK [Desulfobulbaceae bacterium]